MKIIKEICKDIECALDKAEHYAKQAIILKPDYPSLAQRYLADSSTMMDIMSGLHSEVVTIINDYRKTNGEPPAPMMAIYDYMHERFIEKAAAIKNLQDLFKQQRFMV